MDVVEKSFPSRLMKDRARSQAAPSGVSWPLGRPSAATLSFGLVVCLPAAPHNNRGNMQTTRTISNGQEWDCGFFTYTGLVSLRESVMIIGVDYHPSFQQIAFFVEETGECGERQLNHSDGEAERFYRDLKKRGISVRVGMEATGYSRWFERLLAELGFEVWIGDPAEIKTARVKEQKTDRQDARLLLRLMREDNFPRIWVPDPENRDLRQLLWHRHRLGQMRTRIINQLQARAMNEGRRWKSKLWGEQGRAELEKFSFAPWASRRATEFLELLGALKPPIQELNAAAERETEE